MYSCELHEYYRSTTYKLAEASCLLLLVSCSVHTLTLKTEAPPKCRLSALQGVKTQNTILFNANTDSNPVL